MFLREQIRIVESCQNIRSLHQIVHLGCGHLLRLNQLPDPLLLVTDESGIVQRQFHNLQVLLCSGHDVVCGAVCRGGQQFGHGHIRGIKEPLSL